jgi:hypothetical protein
MDAVSLPLVRCHAGFDVGVGATWSGDAARRPHAPGGRCGFRVLAERRRPGARGCYCWWLSRSPGWQPRAGRGRPGWEADGAGAAVLEDREVDHGDPDLVGEFGEGHAALFQQPVQVDGDAVVGGLGGHLRWCLRRPRAAVSVKTVAQSCLTLATFHPAPSPAPVATRTRSCRRTRGRRRRAAPARHPLGSKKASQPSECVDSAPMCVASAVARPTTAGIHRRRRRPGRSRGSV